MQEFNVDLGTKEIYSLKNQSFDIANNGSADLSVDSINLSSDNIVMTFTKTPFQIIQNMTYSLSGYLKILTFEDSTAVDYIECDVSWLDEYGDTQTDVYRYYLNYVGSINHQYVQTFDIRNINYIKDMLVIRMDFNEAFPDQNYPNMIIKAIDSTPYHIFPKIYRMSATSIVYVYKDNDINNIIIDDKIQMNVIFNQPELDIHKISYRSI